MKNLSLPLFLLFLFLVISTESCFYDNEAELHPEKFLQECDTTITVSYSAHIKPILDSSCGTGNSCHSSNNTSGIPLNSYEGVKAQIDNNNRLYSAVTWDGNASFMPKNSTAKLNDCYLARIRLWIESGALNN